MTRGPDSLEDTQLSDDGAALTAAAAQPDQIARFVVLRKLGSGGMGVVYAAWDPRLDRRVALKLVRPDRGSADAHGRLQREAQAMARLSHPNVVSVFDVGSHRGSVWIAMEYVDGVTLRRWLNQETRSWAEIVELFRQAGEGLAAAHAAGLVHRDFKPDNVLLGTDGRARVADFGLVRPSDSDEGADEAASPRVRGQGQGHGPGQEQGLDSSSLGAERRDPDGDPDLEETAGPGTAGPTAALTAVGAIVGTPRYMAPEQFQREVADARSDQFSFCVALYEALYGYPPFAGTRFFELAAAVTLGELRPPPRDSPVPAVIGRALMRGLSREPAARFEDMPSLLAALRVEASPRRWPWAVASVVVAVLAATTAAWLARGEREPSDPCAKGRAQIAQTWSSTREAELRRHFESLELGYADTSLAAVSQGVEAWSQAWAEAYTETCSTRHEQSAELYDMRMACLAQRREQADSLVDLLAEADAELVRDAPQLVSTLPELDACADVETLRAVAPPPADQAAAVSAVREAFARLEARIGAARLAKVGTELAGLRASVERLGYEPLLAELEQLEGQFARLSDDDAGARAHLLRAHELALGLGHDRLALDTATELIRADNFGPGDQGIELARRWFAIAAGLSRRLGAPPEAELERAWALGRTLTRNLRYPEALEQLGAATRLAEQAYGAADLRTAEIRLGLAVALGDDGRLVEAATELNRVIEVYERRLSADHPLLLGPLRARMALANATGELGAGLDDARRQVEIAEASFGPAHSGTIDALQSLAVTYDLRGDHQQARAQFEAILERSGEAGELRSSLGVRTSNSLCFTLYKLDEQVEARAVCERTLSGAGRIHGPEHPIVAIALNNLALIARAQGDPREGLIHDRRALKICEASVGPDHAYTAYSLVGVGEGELALGHPAAALEPLTRALEIRGRAGEPGELGEVQCLLARAQAGASASELDSAKLLAQTGLNSLRRAGPNWSGHAAACADWLTRR
ncbi:Serine/threonine-protein kinase PK-1 [Enhygromyxa salina]|uniref:Serine/threonine-protein kinase PK-1 n=2 Tax=Enhygromyxa salina TaxID=215803 RepID=A0A2S9YE22_9BACT|nr:Serine/threonine-protein kinase PK-1 [Enhygromyxa salina]